MLVGPISDLNIENPTKFVKLSCPENTFPENRLVKRFFNLLTHNLQTRCIMSIFSDFLSFLDIWIKFHGDMSTGFRDFR